MHTVLNLKTSWTDAGHQKPGFRVETANIRRSQIYTLKPR